MTARTFLKTAFGIFGALALNVSIQALPVINGTISYISATVPNNGDLNLATAFGFFPSSIVVSATGDLTLVGPTVLNAPGISGLPLGLGPAPLAVPVLSLWSGGGFNFDLLSLQVDFRSAAQFTASGSGIITALGFDPTPATWTLAITGEGPVIGLTAGSKAPQDTYVPDAGSSLLMLVMGLTSFAVYRRK